MNTKDKIKPIITLKQVFQYGYMFLINHIIGINKRKFYFEGMSGKYNDNSRAVSEKLHELHPDAIIVWGIRKQDANDSHIPSYVKVSVSGISRLYHRATSSGWVSCLTISGILYKSKKQMYVNCWHGDRGVKKIGNDKRPTYFFESNHCDLMTSGSRFYTGLTKSAFCYNGKVLETGCPRNDRLLNIDEERINTIKKEFGIEKTTRLLLYAPTFRDSERDTQSENIDLTRLISILENKTAEKWACLGRFHPTVNHGKFDNEDIIDVTSYYDMADLLLISDIIITDYSSSAFDFTLTGKPVFLYQSDLDIYVKGRELYFNLKETPIMIAYSQEEIEDLIRKTSKEAAIENCKEINSFFGTHESGHASEDVVKLLYSK